MMQVGRGGVRIVKLTEPHAELLAAMVAVEQSAQPDPWSCDQIKTCFCDTCVILGLYVKTELSGFAIARVIAGEAEIYTIGIVRRLQGQGLGSALLGALLEACRQRQAQTCYLEVREHNTPALALYHKYGFEQVGLRIKYYRALPGCEAENALVMRCLL